MHKMKKNKIKKLKRVTIVKIRPKNSENGSIGKTSNLLSIWPFMRMPPQKNKERHGNHTLKTVRTIH